MKYNYHTHSFFCDGKKAPEDYVIRAIENGMNAIGFSSHSPLHFYTKWSMKKEDVQNYIDTINGLKKKYSNRIEIYLSLEVDYLKGEDPLKYIGIKRDDLDYVIGALHFIKNDMGEFISIEGNNEKALARIEKYFNGDARKYIKACHKAYREMLDYYRPEIAAHIDNYKRSNTDNSIFCENDESYRELMYETLLTVKQTGSILEVNTGGMIKGVIDTIYPSKWVLEQCHQLNIPVVISSDAHSPENIMYKSDYAEELLREVGYTKQRILYNNVWQDVLL